jgi:hypothetical protein
VARLSARALTACASLVAAGLAAGEARAACTPEPLVTAFRVVRSWPEPGGVHPADRPVLIELAADDVTPTTPDQTVTVVTPSSFEIAPLGGGQSFGIQTMRSDYGNIRYLPGPYTEWAPTQWDEPQSRRMLVSIQLMTLVAGGVEPGVLEPGTEYTVKMLVGDPEGEPTALVPYAITFTASEPRGPAPVAVGGAMHGMVADTSCEEVHLSCTSADDCSAVCEQEGWLQRVRHEIAVDPDLGLPEDEPWLLEYSVDGYGFVFRQVRFPEDDPSALGALIDVFQAPDPTGKTACVGLRASVYGGGTKDASPACDTAEGIADGCQGGVTADPDADAGDAGTVDAGSPDAGTAEDTASPGVDAGTQPADTSGGGADGGADGSASDGFGTDDGLNGGLPGDPADPTLLPVSDGGCGCDLSDRSGRGASNGLMSLLLLALLWFGLRRRAT